MNYIKQLQAENAALAREVQALRDGNMRLISYLHLPKFSCGSDKDGYVNRNDVLLRIRETETAATERTIAILG